MPISSERYEQLKKIKYEALSCEKCLLYKTRTFPVIGEGSHSAKIIFIGEAPGFNEDKYGRPFCGAAGKILEKLLASIGLKRNDVYICNILKCRPPKNRDPETPEISSCTPYLEKQINIIQPKIICTLGRHSTRFIFEKFKIQEKIQPISKIHGQVFSLVSKDKRVASLFDKPKKKSFEEDLKIITLYHPAVATYNPNMLGILLKDFEAIKNLI